VPRIEARLKLRGALKSGARAERTYAPPCTTRMPALVKICARRGEADARVNLILARTVAVRVPPGLVQHFAEGHDVKCAELVDSVNAAAGVVKAVTAPAGKVKCRGANGSQGVAH
jgi:hypothetical protein